MATKTFSSRADEASLAYADALARKEFGMSFGQYCGTVLVEAIKEGAELPRARTAGALEAKRAAIARIKNIAQLPHNEEVGRMSDAQIKELIESRYESDRLHRYEQSA